MSGNWMSAKKSKSKSRQPNPSKVPLTYLNKDVYDQWKRWCKKKDLIQQRYMSNVITFILGLDNSTRLLFLGEINEEDRTAIAKLILERIANGESGSSGDVVVPDRPGPMSPDEAAKGAVDQSATETTASKDKKETRRKNSRQSDSKDG